MTIEAKFAQAAMSAAAAAAERVETGEAIATGETKNFGEEVLRIVRSVDENAAPTKMAMLKQFSEMIDQHFKALLTIAKNMNVSEDRREDAKQRLKELKKKRDELEQRAKEDMDDENLEDVMEFLEQMVDPADRELLDRQWGRELKG